MRAPAGWCAAVAVVVGSLSGSPRAVDGSTQAGSDAELSAVLTRAGGYVGRYVSTMANLTAEERYLQEQIGVRAMAARPITGPAVPSRTVGGQRRELRSDIVLVNVGPPLEWRVYRDVFEVNGKPVRDRADRLARLFLEPADTARAQAERIAEESARFNLSNMGRVLNEPGLPLVFLLPSLQPRFAFSLDRRGDDEWIVRYQETGRPTLFWHNRTIPNPSSGRFRVDRTTGAIRQAELVVAPATFKATFMTEFRPDDRFGIAVPIEMREQLWTGVDAAARRVQGRATYVNYRRFDVTTEEAGRQNDQMTK
jgi:hypothetical protein